ncbi:ATP-binding protein [Aeromonas salmonicida]|uniref:ATP-binding protein n=1 Tax=Aeromonas salmonicida TaxID=645 RepID=UPI001F181C59|nr:transporter substrate-binding domain-containing protein [Aeromonas salmonicida]MCE9935555.1 transporter substrate-binding domain-containing protein [Aeromonas salmonicida]
MEYFKKYFLSFFLLITIHPNCLAKYTDEYIKVFSRESSYNYSTALPAFTAEQLIWLRKKELLVLAVPLPDNPPMDITMQSGNYEGATADVLGLLSKILDIDIVARKYPSRDAAIMALKKGEADMISSANGYEVNSDLSLTEIYLEDQPALYKNIGVSNERINKVAVADAYLPMAEIIKILPGVKIENYTSRYSAVAAVAYGEADAVLIDMVSGNYIVNKLYQDSVHLVRPLFAQTRGFAFGLKSDDDMLREVVNIALRVVTTFHHDSILKRWSGGGLSIESKPAMLTEEEWQWINRKGVLKIAVNKGAPPLSFIDVRGNLHGISLDILQVIGAKLGIQVIPVPIGSSIEQLDRLGRREVDAIIITPTKSREATLQFSSAFMLDPIVMVVKKNQKLLSASEILERGRIAQIKGMRLEYPDGGQLSVNNPVWVKKLTNAVECVFAERCDMALVPLRAAKYLINSEYSDSLIIVGELFDSMPIGASFAANKDQPNLIGIINKVLASIPPDELDILATRWRVSAKHDEMSFYEFVVIYAKYIFAAVLMLLLAFLWILYLRRQIKLRKKAEIELNTQLNFIEELVDSTPHPIYARDVNSRLILCNSSYAAFFDTVKSDLIGLTIEECERRWPYMSILGDVYRKTVQDAEPRDGDHELQLTDRVLNIYHWIQVSRGLSEAVDGVVGGWIDISERASLIEQLDNASRDAQAASRAKSTFLATMSHEIRTPMNAIIGMLELTLRKDGLNTEDRDAIRVAYQASHDLLGLIGDILDLSKIESGKLELSPSPQHINVLNQSVINIFSVVARQKGLALRLHDQHDVAVMVDPVRYKQVLSNLVSNAIKFTRKGGVELVVDLQPDGEWCDITVSVIDTGIGISDEDLEYLFLPFSQATQPADIQKSGTGLGLMISRTLCQMMGGDLEISSELGLGTKVIVSLKLPLAETLAVRESHSEERVAPSYDDAGYRILVIDDHPTNLLLVSQQLTFLGHEVLTASSGKSALQLLSKEPVDIIITDFNMPDIDGLEFTGLLRQQERDDEALRTVVIGLTADARQDQVQRAVEVGMDDCLFKPVSLDDLKVCLATHHPGKMLLTPEDMAARFMHKLSNLTVGSSELMSALLNEFVNASEQDMLHLAEACMQGNSQKFLAQLHRLKGGARILGADELVACCTEWEQSPRLPLCMPAALRQVRNIYQQVKAGVDYWNKEHKTRGE